MYLDAYGPRLCTEVHAARGHGGQTIVVREAFSRIRPLADIRAGGGIGKRDEHSSKFTCP